MADKKKFIIGSRGSKLSLAYSSYVKNLLVKFNPEFDSNSIEIKIIKTSGDIFKNKARIRLSTIHGIKGGESDNVVVISDISYKTWKKFNIEPDDEHRVFYVAVTRAKENLYIVEAQKQQGYRI